MRRTSAVFRTILASIALAASGCAVGSSANLAQHTPSPTATKRPRPVVGLVDVKLSRLLDFESTGDMVFVQNRVGSTIQRDSSGDASHGVASLRVVRGTDGATFRLKSLLQGRAFPGTWNLIGLQARTANGDAKLRLSLRRNGVDISSRVVPITSQSWDWAWLETGALKTPSPQPSTDAIELVAALDGSPSTLLIDGVALGDNARRYSSARDGDHPEPGLQLTLDGLRWTVDSPGVFGATVPSPESGIDGYLRQSQDPWRVVFATRDGRTLVIDRTGRAYAQGKFRPLRANDPDADAIVAQHDRPGRIDIDLDYGRIERTSSGDADNDGYDESRGTYRLAATGPRLVLTIAPAAGGPALVSPTLEIRNLPAGDLVVNVEGKLIDDWIRLDDGSVLVRLPLQIDRATRVDVRVRPAASVAAGETGR
ncbi:MAG: hypothetical protein QM770_00710 [Tepidisphaeraceae bacterium]